MGLELPYELGQTPLDEDEKEGLLIRSISTRGELDQFEQQNIEDAIVWTISKKFSAMEIVSDSFVRKLHEKMFGDVWRWAGSFRRTNKNIGVDKNMIGVTLQQLLADTLYWIEHNIYPPDELTIRFKHRLVFTHCFPNGNGRHSRLMADVLISHVFDQPVYRWSGSNLVHPGDQRKKYLEAIWKADAGDIGSLIAFAKS